MTTKMPEPTVLEGGHVRLEPLALTHVPDLYAAGGGDEEVWRWMPRMIPETEAQMRELVLEALARQSAGDYTCFAVVQRETGRTVGSTSLMNVPQFDQSIEIGYTWYARSVWRSAVNTESKLLLLTHAFEEVGYNRVMLKTDNLNIRSQNAIARLGAVREGTLRRQVLRRDGTWRDTVYFSILAEEWPDAKQALAARLARGSAARTEGRGPII
jgi:RimJ/RimL family protein N-acetyltransferase